MRSDLNMRPDLNINIRSNRRLPREANFRSFPALAAARAPLLSLLFSYCFTSRSSKYNKSILLSSRLSRSLQQSRFQNFRRSAGQQLRKTRSEARGTQQRGAARARSTWYCRSAARAVPRVLPLRIIMNRNPLHDGPRASQTATISDIIAY